MSQVSEQILSSLLAKQTLASSPGVATTDLYFSSTNSQKEIIPTTTYVGRYIQNLQSTAWGSSSQVVVPSNGLTGQVFLRVRLALPVNGVVSSGWGYNCIRSISYIWGSSNTSQLTIHNPSILSYLLTTAPTMGELGSDIIYQGGKPYPDTAALPSVVTNIEATLMLPLPFSTPCPDRPPFDMSLLAGSSPFILRVDLAPQWQNVFSFMNTVVGTTGGFAGLISAEVIFSTTEVLDTSLSLSTQLRADPSLIASYPFQHIQTFPTNDIPAQVSTSGGYGGPDSPYVTVNLTSFLRSDLVGIIFNLQNTADITGTASISSVVAPTFISQDMLDLELQYNGQILFKCPGESYKLIGTRGRMGAAYCAYYQNSFTAPGPNTSTPERYMYIPYFNSTYMGAKSQCSPFFQPNTSRYPNQVLNVRFKVPYSATAQTYNLTCTYIYSALAEVDADGRVALMFS
jgi:hypothetical protein